MGFVSRPGRTWRERRAAKREQWVLRALERHPQEEFSGTEVLGLAHVGLGRYDILIRLENQGRIVSRWENGKPPRRRLYKLAPRQGD